MLFIYQVISILLAPFLRILILYRIFKQKECPQRINEKFGLAKSKKPIDKKVIWIHAVSVGEANSAFNLVFSSSILANPLSPRIHSSYSIPLHLLAINHSLLI